MDAIFHSILSYVLIYKYLGIFALTTIASAGFPVPGTAIIMASGAFASQGYFGFVPVYISALLGNITGNNVMYWISRKYRTSITERSRMHSVFSSKVFFMLERSMSTYSSLIVFFTRFLGTIGSVVNIAAGLLKMSYRIFFPIGCFGEAVAVFVFCASGYIFGSHWGYVVSIASKFGGVIVSGILIALLIKYQKRIKRMI